MIMVWPDANAVAYYLIHGLVHAQDHPVRFTVLDPLGNSLDNVRMALRRMVRGSHPAQRDRRKPRAIRRESHEMGGEGRRRLGGGR